MKHGGKNEVLKDEETARVAGLSVEIEGGEEGVDGLVVF